MKMKFKKQYLAFAAIAALAAAIVFAAPAFASDNQQQATTPDLQNIIKNRIIDYNGWTWDKSAYPYQSAEYIDDLKQHCYAAANEAGKSFTDRLQNQAWVLGWDKRFDYVDQYGTVDETGNITYDIPFPANIGVAFAGGTDRWFKTQAEYDQVMQLYNDNYNAAAQPVPREV